MLLQQCGDPELWQPFQQDMPTRLGPGERSTCCNNLVRKIEHNTTPYLYLYYYRSRGQYAWHNIVTSTASIEKLEIWDWEPHCVFYVCTFANLHSLIATSHWPDATCWWRRVGKGLRLLMIIVISLRIKQCT